MGSISSQTVNLFCYFITFHFIIMDRAYNLYSCFTDAINQIVQILKNQGIPVAWNCYVPYPVDGMHTTREYLGNLNYLY